jgi:transposase
VAHEVVSIEAGEASAIDRIVLAGWVPEAPGVGDRTFSRRWHGAAVEAGLMFFPEGQVRVWLYTEPTDMRKSFNGLSGMVKQVKVLYFDRSGYCIWSKRLVQGQFNHATSATSKQSLDWLQLKLMLEGIELKNTRQYKRFARS